MANKIVTGCRDCPLYDETGAEYGRYCHHPQRPLTVEVSDTSNNYASIEPTEKEIHDYIKEYLSGDDNVQELLKESRKDKRYPNVEEPTIEKDEKYTPVTPDWCPLKKEPITIELETLKK
jgi:hypothetical protein